MIWSRYKMIQMWVQMSRWRSSSILTKRSRCSRYCYDDPDVSGCKSGYCYIYLDRIIYILNISTHSKHGHLDLHLDHLVSGPYHLLICIHLDISPLSLIWSSISIYIWTHIWTHIWIKETSWHIWIKETYLDQDVVFHSSRFTSGATLFQMQHNNLCYIYISGTKYVSPDVGPDVNGDEWN